jgi:hypothetical protein
VTGSGCCRITFFSPQPVCICHSQSIEGGDAPVTTIPNGLKWTEIDLLDLGALLVKDGASFSYEFGRSVSGDNKPIKQTVMNEIALALTFVFAGLVLLPIAVYLTGQSVFGEYGGAGFADFYGRLSSEIRSGRPVVWFLVLSPYLVFLSLRLTIRALRRSTRSG